MKLTLGPDKLVLELEGGAGKKVEIEKVKVRRRKNGYWIYQEHNKVFTPGPETRPSPPPELPIRSDNFFFLTSSSFSNDLSKGLKPTILKNQKQG